MIIADSIALAAWQSLCGLWPNVMLVACDMTCRVQWRLQLISIQCASCSSLQCWPEIACQRSPAVFSHIKRHRHYITLFFKQLLTVHCPPQQSAAITDICEMRLTSCSRSVVSENITLAMCVPICPRAHNKCFCKLCTLQTLQPSMHS